MIVRGRRATVEKARRVFAHAKRNGLVTPPPTCALCGRRGPRSGSGRIEGHHEDYRKPLDVVWLCTCCHSIRHRQMRSARRRRHPVPALTLPTRWTATHEDPRHTRDATTLPAAPQAKV